ncbi:MAG TPA: TetR/AcrR family transcriptional regulator [Actinomycetota bacterium]|nr:TetR/AcrR family transcriptional regulator [Actinomycetota bacterium]
MMSQSSSDVVSDRLLDSAASLVIQGGPSAATVSAIAAEAGVSRMTVYRKFPDRHAIISALFDRELGAIVAEAALIQSPSQRERIVEAIALSVQRINEHPLMSRVLRNEPEELIEWITGHLGGTQRMARSALQELIVGGQPGTGDGSVRAGNPDAMSLTLVLVAQTFVFAHRIGGTDAELRRLVKGYLT